MAFLKYDHAIDANGFEYSGHKQCQFYAVGDFSGYDLIRHCDALSDSLIAGRHSAIDYAESMYGGEYCCHLLTHVVTIAGLIFIER